MDSTVKLSADERAALRLRRLYENRGFLRVRPSKFEEHALYIQNKNFLQSDQIITFMDMDGKLLALKPDVTLSIVKNMPAEPMSTFQKLYYIDEVYRVSPESREYKALSQIGVELVGPVDALASIEVVDLALLSLELLGEAYVLDLSHLGFVSGLLADLQIPHAAEGDLLAAIHAKSSHEIGAVLDAQNADESARNRILALADLHGSIGSVLPQARALITSDDMRAAYNELATLAEALRDNGASRHLNLDFSVVNHLDYYNGLIFQGYVKGLPQHILSGGRYDNLMHKMGKKSGAAGFAVSLDDLNTYIRTGRPYDFDLVITYSADCDCRALLKTVKQYTDAGTSVRLERAGADLSAVGYSWKEHRRFDGQTLLAKEDA